MMANKSNVVIDKSKHPITLFAASDYNRLEIAKPVDRTKNSNN